MAKSPEVEKMIAKVMKKKDLSHSVAIEYMLAVATGRLAALWRYDASLPEDKANKGILVASGRKKRAPRSKAIVTLAKPDDAPAKPKRVRKPKAPKQLEIKSEAAE